MTDELLIQQYVADGSDDAFRQIVARYLRMVYAACLREVRNAEMAQDVTQIVFMLLARNARRLRSGIALSSWLFTTARFASRAALRGEDRRRRNEMRAVAEMPGYDDHDAHGESLDAIEPWLNEALSSLKPKDREALLLRYAEEHSLREIGERYGISEQGAHIRVARALEKLRRGLKNRGIDAPESAVLSVVLISLLTGSMLILPSSVSAAAIAHTVPSILTGIAGTTAAGARLSQLSRGINQTMRIQQIKIAGIMLAGCLAVGITAASGMHWRRGAAIRYVVTDLGTLPGYSSSGAAAINNKGEIVGSVSEGAGVSGQPFYYHDGAISKISVPPGYNACSAYGINDQGTIIGDAFKIDRTGGFDDPLIGTRDKLSTYTPPASIMSIHFRAINNTGTITGDYNETAANTVEAIQAHATFTSFILTEGKLQPITTSSYFFSGGFAINNNGVVVGFMGPEPRQTQMFLNSGNKTTTVSCLPGYFFVNVRAINNHEDITGTWRATPRTSPMRAFLYHNGSLTELGTLPGFVNSESNAISPAGVIVGCVIKGLGDPSDPHHAVLFENGHATDLNTLIDPASGWELSSASSINDSGQIVGSGRHNGADRAFLLTPKS